MRFFMGENHYKKKLSRTNVIRAFVTCLIEPSSKVWFSWSFWLKSIKSSIKLLEVLNQSLWSIKLKNLKSSIEVLNYLTSLRKVLKLFNSGIWSQSIWSLHLKYCQNPNHNLNTTQDNLNCSWVWYDYDCSHHPPPTTPPHRNSPPGQEPLQDSVILNNHHRLT